jgi:acyl-CoA reductase-like NAD-dependent aldehyde dehydrogenase
METNVISKLFNSTTAQIDAAVLAADAATQTWGASTGAERASLLRALAQGLEEDRIELVVVADRETGLGATRLNGELDRTAFQLRGFADRCEQGAPFAFVDNPEVAGAPPAGHSQMIRVRVPVGVVAMFSASNFPFAFSVLGGDTASALAAGCPIVVKAHPGHPGLSRKVHSVAQRALIGLNLPPSLIGMVEGAGISVGVSLVQQAAVQAVAFTGSVRGGLALQAECQQRPRPIPFYGELGSVNPVIALPGMLIEHSSDLADKLAASIALGCGQFCTSPGIIVAFDDRASDDFLEALTRLLSAQTPHGMLTPGIRSAFESGVARQAHEPGVKVLTRKPAASTDASPQPTLLSCDVATFLSKPILHDEVFGPMALVVRVSNVDEVIEVLRKIGGTLTVTLWGAEVEHPDTQRLVREASRIAGRVLFTGVPTGVAVTAAQHHGGPYPASTEPFSTSVGFAAMDRFLRPVAMQDPPAWLKARDGRPC